MTSPADGRLFLPRFRSKWTAALVYVALLLNDPLSVRAIYAPDENHNAVWVPLSWESSSPSYSPNTNDDNGNGKPDWEDEFEANAANGWLLYWSGGTWVVDGVATSYGGQWLAALTDSDGDLLPDTFDPYPSDATNNSFFWLRLQQRNEASSAPKAVTTTPCGVVRSSQCPA